MDRQSSREELMAQVLWTFIERLREEPGSAAVKGLDGLAPADAEELAALLCTAGSLRAALDEAPDGAFSGARARVEAAILRHRQESDAPREGIRGRWLRPAGSGAFTLRWRRVLPLALAAAALCATLLAGFALGLRSAAPVGEIPVPPAVSGGQSGRCCNTLKVNIERLVQGNLEKNAAHALIEHMTRCPGCFADYYRQLHSGRGARRRAPSEPLQTSPP